MIKTGQGQNHPTALKWKAAIDPNKRAPDQTVSWISYGGRPKMQRPTDEGEPNSFTIRNGFLYNHSINEAGKINVESKIRFGLHVCYQCQWRIHQTDWKTATRIRLSQQRHVLQAPS